MNADPPKDDAIVPKPRSGFHLPPVSAAQAICFVAVLGTLGWAYEPTLVWFYQTWVREPDYTHGFLVLPIALAILWKRWPGPAAAANPEMNRVPEPASNIERITSLALGWFLVATALAGRALFLERGQNWLEASTLLILLIGLAVAGLGWRRMFRIWPAFAYLIFLYPLPPQINSALSQPLQSLATTFACGLLKLTGLWVMPEGNVILVGNERLEVAAACNGLSMLMSLAATVAAAASLIPMSVWKRVLLLVSIIPIALLSNVLRIAATAWCYYEFGAEVGSKYAHDAAGLLMMPTAMMLVGLELAVASWLIVETEEVEPTTDKLGLGLVAGPPNPLAQLHPKPGTKT